MNTNYNLSKQDEKIIKQITPLMKKTSELYLVGGFLRDKLLSKDSFDMDFIVKGQNAIELAKKFADETERYFIVLDEKYEIARVIDQDKIHYFDFARCENDDIICDLNRRDLTINSIAMMVYPEIKDFDILNGKNDFNKKIIKTINEQNLIDDPLRLLRIFRFASILNFDIEKETFDFVNKHYSLINNVAAERIFVELMKLLEGNNSAKYINLLRECGLLYQIFELLHQEEKIPPNSHHHLNLINHSIETIHQLELLLKNTPKFVIDKLNSYQCANVKYLSLLKLAALLHDVGKPKTWSIEENGRHRFINHDAVGAELLKPDLKAKKFSKAQIKYITTLVKNHIYPSQLAKENEEANEKPIFRMFRKLEDCTPDVLLLAMADRLSAQGPAITKEMTENNINALNRYMCMYEKFLQTEKPLPKLLDGNEVAKILNIKKDKNLGEILKQLHNAQMSNEVITKDDAIKFIKKLN